MLSRRNILLRAKKAENVKTSERYTEEEDIWFDQDKLFKDHIQEVLSKWDQIDDEIWAKIIVMERNRRVAKAYARAPFIIFNGSDIGFDGLRVGLKGFDNSERSEKTKEILDSIGEGVKMKMDEKGNILVKRVGRSQVFVKSASLKANEATCIGKDILEAKGKLEFEKSMTLFDIKAFQRCVAQELKETYPERKKLEAQCISCFCFVKDTNNLLGSESWIMIINIVALELLKSKICLRPKSLNAINEIMDKKSNEKNKTSSSSNGKSIMFDKELIKFSDKKNSKPLAKVGEQIKVGKDDRIGKQFHISLPVPDYDCDITVKTNKSVKNKDDPYYSGLSAKVGQFNKHRENMLTHGADKQYLSRKMKTTRNPLTNRFYSYSSSDSSPSSCDTSYSTFYNSIPDGLVVRK